MDPVRLIPEHNVFLLLAQFALVLATARLMGHLVRIMGQPAVLGELFAGIFLGPSILGLWAPHVSDLLFPAEPLASNLLETIAWLGMIFLLFITGLETQVDVLRSLGRPALVTAATDLTLLFSSGVVLGSLLPDDLLGPLGNRTVLALFMGLSLAITAVPVLAKILFDLGLVRRNIGVALLGAGIAEDLVGWMLFAVIVDLAREGHVALGATLQAIAVTALFVLGAWFVGAPLVDTLLRWADERSRTPFRRVTVGTCVMLGCAAATHRIGIHALFGAFIAGIIVARSPRFRAKDRESMDALALGVFSPVFFSFAGLQVRLGELDDLSIFAAILAVAVVGKLGGAYLGGRLGGFRPVEALAMGIGMNARGAMEIVLAMTGLAFGIVSPELFSMIVLMAVVTSLMTPPLLTVVARWLPVDEEEAERLRREEQEARAVVPRKDLRVLVPSRNGNPGAALVGFATMVSRAVGGTATLLVIRGQHASLLERVRRWIGRDEETRALRAETDALRSQSVENGSGFDVRMVASELPQDVILEEAGRGYGLVLLGAHSGRDPFSGPVLHQVVAECRAHIGIMQPYGADDRNPPFGDLLIAVKGGATFPLMLEVAALYLEGVGQGRMTLLHVGRAGPRRDALLVHARELAEDALAQAVADGKGVSVAERVVEADRVSDGILLEATRGPYDLVVLGATRYVTRDRLWFGRTVDDVVRRAPCATLILTPSLGGTPRAPFS